MDKLFQLNSKRAGRDKIFRVLQYGLKIVAGSSARAADMEKEIANFRKLLRFGTCLDTLATVKATSKIQDPVQRAATSISKLALALYLYYDHLVYLSKHDLISGDVIAWSEKSNTWWLISIALNIVNDVQKIRNVIAKSNCGSNSELLELLISRRSGLVNSLILNIFDIMLPISMLKIISIPPWVVGSAGVISSGLGILPMINPELTT